MTSKKKSQTAAKKSKTTDKSRAPSSKDIPKEKTTALADVPAKQQRETHYVVAIGASAGGLEALKEVIAELPRYGVISCVVAQHLSPTHTSLMTELLSSVTELPVRELSGPQPLYPDTIYVTPPNRDVIYSGGMLNLTEPQSTVGPKPSIDRFFKTLADDRGEDTIAIILSGTGSDGAAGIRAVKSAGGITLVQEPESAKYDGMPRAAIQTGCVDSVLKPKRMAEALLAIVNSSGLPQPSGEVPPGEDDTAQIVRLVRGHTGFDLNQYKISTLSRRIRRRMALHTAASLADYAELLQDNKEEAKQLAMDILISVTSFFRDPESFEALRDVIKKIVRSKEQGDVIRVWVPGCATGEEAYSIAMLVADVLRDQRNACEFLIFASDLDQSAVAHARAGIYADSSVGHLPEIYRDRYLEREGHRYHVRKTLRQCMVFASQNVVQDPPFSRMDLISCRNLLIYFTRPIQKRVLEIFHYALRPQGFLFLGKSESIESHHDLFENYKKAQRVFRRVGNAPVYNAPQRYNYREPAADQASGTRQAQRTERSPYSLRMREALLESYCPPAVMVDEKDQVVHFTGDVRPFLSFPSGPADLRVFDMVDSNLRAELRAMLHRCRREGGVISGTVGKYKIDGQLEPFQPVVRAINVDKHAYVLLAFEARPEKNQKQPALPVDTSQANARIIEELEKELAGTREHLQTVVEELETSNEELQSQSEELQSSNEELQSTNEELQTANEEMQSTNEELLTVNDEMQQKSNELSRLAEDLRNIKESVDFPLIVVDRQLRLTQSNDSATKLLRLAEIDADRSLTSIEADLDLLSVLPTVKQVIKQGRPRETTLEDTDGRSYLIRMMPYFSGPDTMGGAVISLIDVSDNMRTQAALREREALYRVSFEGSQVGMAMIDLQRRFTKVNPALYKLLGYSENQLLGKTAVELTHPDDLEENQRQIERLASGEKDYYSVEKRFRHARGHWVWTLLNLTIQRDQDQQPQQFVGQILGIDAEVNRRERLQQDRQRLNVLNRISRSLVEKGDMQTVITNALTALAEAFPGVQVAYGVLDAKAQLSIVAARGNKNAPDTKALKPLALTPRSKPVKDLRAGQLVSIEDLSKGQLMRAQRPALCETGAQALVLIPTQQDEADETALICLFAAEPRRWSDYELDMSRAMADLLRVGATDARLREDRTRALSALSDEKERVQTTLQSIGDGVITTDVDMRVTYLNPSAEKLTGVALREASGRDVNEVFHPMGGPKKDQPVGSLVARCLKERRVIEQTDFGVALISADQRQIAIDSSAAPIINHSDQMIGAVLVFRDITDQQLLAEELSYRASHDLLTGLHNRDEFDRVMNHEITQARRGRKSDVLLFLDLDRFKIVNDTCGHAAGDELLRQVADTFRECLRKSDMIARLGGDEFGVLLRNCDLTTGERIAASLINALEKFRFSWSGRKFTVGVSIGVVQIAENNEGVSRILARADAACYAAKNAGRNRYYVSGSPEDIETGRHGEVQLVSIVAEAVEQERFHLVAQDVAALSRPGMPVEYREFLVRLTSDSGEEISPAAFIPIAERYSLMNTVDRAVAGHAIRLIAEQPAEDQAVYAINLSGQTFSDPKFISFIQDALTSNKVEPSRVCFEITETAAVSQLSAAARFINKLREMGCRFALDDFGTGMSSFAYLKNLPLDYIKIDGSFVKNMLQSNVDRAVVESAVRIGGELGISTIAEHVETAELLEALKGTGVHLVQGYHIAKPTPLLVNKKTKRIA